MSTFASKIPTYLKIFHAIFNWRTARRVLLGGAILVTLIVAFYLEELWRGERAWDAARREFEAQGGTFDLQKLAPPPVPDEQNFVMTPLLKPLFPQGSLEQLDKDAYQKYASILGNRLQWPVADGMDPHGDEPHLGDWPLAKAVDLQLWQKFFGQTDILLALKKLDPELNEISAASRRPAARYLFEYEKGVGPQFPVISLLLHLSRIYGVRAVAELAAGQTDRAAEDTVTIFQLANSFTNVPFQISQLSSMTLAGIGTQVLWEGLVAHRWSDAQLVEFTDELQKFDYLAGEQLGFEGDVARHNQIMEQAMTDPTRLDGEFQGPYGRDNHQGYDTISLLSQDLEDHLHGWLRLLEEHWCPRGWLYQNRVVYLQDLQKVLTELDVPRHRVDAEKSKAIDTQLAQRKSTPFNFIANAYNGGMEWAGLNCSIAVNQASLDEAQVACALERFQLANGQLPETLAELAPKFIAKLPTDIISGGPLHYQRKADGHFLLYEVGWTGTDDGGVVGKDSAGEPDLEKGDWVWPDAVAP